MKIHHATAKRAASMGIELTTDGELAIASWSEKTLKSDDAKIALDAMLLWKRIEGEYPGVATVSIEIEEENRVIVAVGDDTCDVEDIHNADEAYGQVCDELGEMLEAAADEEPEYVGTVVKPHYRATYAERGNANHCGDWLAGFLDGMFVSKGEKGSAFDVRAFTEFLVMNGVAMTGKWASLPGSGQKGWEGRYRMNGRQIVEKWIALRGHVITANATVDVPAEALEVLRTKHAKWIAKETAKQAA